MTLLVLEILMGFVGWLFSSLHLTVKKWVGGRRSVLKNKRNLMITIHESINSLMPEEELYGCS